MRSEATSLRDGSDHCAISAQLPSQALPFCQRAPDDAHQAFGEDYGGQVCLRCRRCISRSQAEFSQPRS